MLLEETFVVMKTVVVTTVEIELLLFLIKNKNMKDSVFVFLVRYLDQSNNFATFMIWQWV